jgi:hypothetical protein
VNPDDTLLNEPSDLRRVQLMPALTDVGLDPTPLPFSVPVDDAHPATAQASAITFAEYRNVRIS